MLAVFRMFQKERVLHILFLLAASPRPTHFMWDQIYEVLMQISFFSDGWETRWVGSKSKGDEQGKFEVSAGKFYGDAEKDKGMNMFRLKCAKLVAEHVLTS